MPYSPSDPLGYIASTDIDIKVDSAQAEGALARVAAGAKAMGASASTSAKQMTSGFEKAAKALNQNQTISQLETVSSLFIQVGGDVSRLASVATSAIRPLALLGSTVGGIGLAALSVPVGLAAIGVAANALASSAVEAGDRLQKLGIQVGPEAAQNLLAYKQATADLSIAMDMLRVAAGSEFAGNLATLASAAAGAVRMFTGLTEAIQPVVDLLQTGLRVWLLGASLGMTEAAMAGVQFGAAMNDAEQHTDTLTDSIRALEQASQDAAEQSWLARDAHVAATTDQLVALGMLQSEEEEEAEILAVIAEGARQNAIAREQQAEALRNAAAAAREAAAAERELSEIAAAEREALLADNENFLKTQADRREEFLKTSSIADEAAAAEIAANEAVTRSIQETIDWQEARAASLRQVWATVADSTLSTFTTVTDGIVASYQARAAAGEELSQKELAAASLAFGLSKSFAASQAIIQAAVVTLGMAAQLAAYTPAAIPLAVAAGGALLASQLAAIASAPAPEFPGGLSPDHHLVGIQAREGVATGRAVSAVGGPDAFDDLNRGVAPAGGSVQIVLGRRTLAEAVWDVQREARVNVDRRRGKAPRRTR